MLESVVSYVLETIFDPFSNPRRPFLICHRSYLLLMAPLAPEPKDKNFKFDQPFNNENEAHTPAKVRNQIGMLIIGVALGVCFQFHFGGGHDAVGTNHGLAIDAARGVVAKIGENLVKLLLWLADAIRARI